MSVKLRLTRMGRKKRPYYRIVAVDSRKKRDGAFLDRIGYYHPIDQPATLQIDGEKALKWLRTGAIPSDTVLSLFRREGVWLRFRLERRGLPQTQIDTMMVDWYAKHKKAAPAVAPKAIVAAPVAPVVQPKVEIVVEDVTEATSAPVEKAESSAETGE